MKPPTSVFTLGGMRHLDLLALWHQLNPDSHLDRTLAAAGLSKERLIVAILAST